MIPSKHAACEPAVRVLRPVPPPFDLVRSLRRMFLGPLDPCWSQDGPTRCAFALYVGSGLVVVAAEQHDTQVHVAMWGPGAGEAVERVDTLLGLHDDPSAFRPDHPLLRAWQREHAGLRLAKTVDVPGALLRAILQQRVRWKDAATSWRRIVREQGEPDPYGVGVWVPPDPSVLRRAPSWFWREHGVDLRRAQVLIEACRLAPRIHRWQREDEDTMLERLSHIPGVGPWTLGTVACVSLGRPDDVLLGDLHLPHTAAWNLWGEPRGTDEQMVAWLEPYRPHRGRIIGWLQRSGKKAPRFGTRPRTGSAAAR